MFVSRFSVGLFSVLLGCAVASAAVDTAVGNQTWVYPAVPRGTVVDNYHGTRVADPYRALEALDSETVRSFIGAQNALSVPWLQQLPQRAWIKQRLSDVWNYERFGVPRKEGGRYFYLRNDGTQNQSVLHVASSLEDPGHVLLDPNTSSSDATVALARYVPSPDGQILAYSYSDAGTDWEVWHFRNVADGVDRPDMLRFTKFWELSWSRDSSGVYYSRYPRRHFAKESEKGNDKAQPAIYFHRIGARQSADRRIYRVRDSATRVPSAQVTEDGRYLVVSLFDGYRTNGVRLLDLRRKRAKATELFGAWDGRYTVLGSQGDQFFVLTTQNAERGRIIAVDARNPASKFWRTVVPESATGWSATSPSPGSARSADSPATPATRNPFSRSPTICILCRSFALMSRTTARRFTGTPICRSTRRRS
jgi:prolyl oligopeptidase